MILPSGSAPATLATIETSSASDGVNSGKMPGRQAASSDLPAPGGPLIKRLCPPAAAISSARLAVSCPFTWLRSGPGPSGSASPACGGDSVELDRKSVVQGKSVDLGGRRIIKKKNTTSI